jgi:hypothetical protein
VVSGRLLISAAENAFYAYRRVHFCGTGGRTVHSAAENQRNTDPCPRPRVEGIDVVQTPDVSTFIEQAKSSCSLSLLFREALDIGTLLPS